MKLPETRCKTHLRRGENQNPMNFYQPSQEVAAPKRKHLRNHMKYSWYRATGLQKGLFLLGHGLQKLFLSQHRKATAFHHPSRSCCNIPCCLSSSSSTSTGINLLASHSPLVTGFAALCQAVNVTRICQIQSRGDHGALSERCTQFFH